MKKIISLILACTLCISLGATTFADGDGLSFEPTQISQYQPGSGGMLQCDRNGQVSFIPPQQNNTNDSVASVPGNGVRGVSNSSAIVLIEAMYDGSPVYGSGTLIGPTGIFTAAHCIYNRDINKWADEVSVYVPGKGWYDVDMKYIGGEYREKDFDDWGIVTLYDAPNVGYYGYSSNTPSSLYREPITVAGYTDAYEHYFTTYTGTMGSQQAERTLPGVRLLCNVQGGMSGGPVIKNANSSVVGIVIEETAAGQGIGLLINSWMFNALNDHSGR